MKHIYPSYYKKFKCIANKCPDSCCKDWDVVVDEESEGFYNTVNTEFGEKIRNLTVTDNDGDRIFVSQNGRCPFWNKDMLCDIYINLGEEHLCATCQNFPRITQDYTTFVEHTLSLACPEGARLILEEENDYSEFECFTYNHSDELMEFLLKARVGTSEIFKNRKASFSERLKKALLYNAEIQNCIDEENLKIPEYDFKNKTSEKADCSYVFELHKKLEIMSDEWKAILDLASDNEVDFNHDIEFERLALYYIYRYYLNAIDSLDVLSPIKRIACAYVVLSRCELTGNCTRLMQLYSKEVEHSYENTDILEFEFCTAYEFSVENLIKIL